MKLLQQSCFLLVTFTFLLCSCNLLEQFEEAHTAKEEDGVTYSIYPGEHESTTSLRAWNTNSLRFEVQFDSTAIYATSNPLNQEDINKLFGMSDCNSLHHENSARFGWRWFNNRLELLAYSYARGKNTSTFITAIDLKKIYTCEIALVDNKYIYRIGDKVVEHTRFCTGKGMGYQLNPYFGGDETAPHLIKIKIKVLN